MHVVVADPMQVRLADDLQAALGPEVTLELIVRPEQIDKASKTADVFVGSRLSAQQLSERANLRLIQVAGAGYEGIDLTAVPPGAIVANTSHHGRAIAEYCLMAMLVLSRDLLTEDSALRTGTWRSVFQDPTSPVHETLDGRTVGIIGLGEIGSQVAKLASSLGMRVNAIRRTPSTQPHPDADWVGTINELPRLLRTADFVVITVPLDESTRGLIGDRELSLMSASSVLINVARGPIVQEQALYDALHGGRLRGAAIDVWWQYPQRGNTGAPSRFPFGELQNVLVTPHTSGVTSDVFRNRMHDVAANITALRDGTPLRNVVFTARS